ncbi:hypothetical protein D9M69_466710 [compost metagenome]
MVPVNFNMVGYDFSRGIRILKEGYASAILALKQKADTLGTQLLEYREHLAHGGEPDEERDAEGFLLWDRERLLEMDLAVCSDGLGEVRKAFVIALYHHWERAVRKDTGYSKQKHDELLEAAAAAQIAVQPDLEKVRHLVNTLKHNNEKRGSELLKHWPEVFPSEFHHNANTDWYQSIGLTDAHVHQALNIIAGSGPEAMRFEELLTADSLF